MHKGVSKCITVVILHECLYLLILLNIRFHEQDSWNLILLCMTQVASSFDNDQHDKKIPLKTKEENANYQLPQSKPTPAHCIQKHIKGSIVRPTAVSC